MPTHQEIAIILAAGMGQRMLPLTERIAKPLIPVHGIPMIETVIKALEKRKISKIYVVVGYKKDQFAYLTRHYENIELIENAEYLEKNNISSIKAVAEIMGIADCFICEADLFIANDSEFLSDFQQSCYWGKLVEGHSGDWVFDTVGGRITEIKLGGENLYNMTGVSYWRKDDACIIADAVNKAYEDAAHGSLFWDEVVNRVLNRINVCVHPIKPGQIYEIDTVEELERIGGDFHVAEPS